MGINNRNHNNTKNENIVYPAPPDSGSVNRENYFSLLESKQNRSNFSLCFSKLIKWERNDNSKQSNDGVIKCCKNNIKELAKMAESHICHSQYISDSLNKIQERQKNYIKEMESANLQTIEIYAETASPFITGLGSGHPTETGMILDRNTGVPYLPASSIKGVLRLAHAVNIANGRSAIPNNELDIYFGSTDDSSPKKGQVIFLDAYPTEPPVIKCDIMNPHFPKYYSSKQDKRDSEHNLPLENEQPIPISFLSVAIKTRFCFRGVLSPLPSREKSLSQKDRQIIFEAFKTAFSVIGFGGKTSIGYGRFKIISGN